MEEARSDLGSSDARFYRLTGLLGLIGGGLALIANGLHPRQGPNDLGDTEDLLDMVAGFGLWRLDHLLVIFSLLLGMIALIGLAHSLVAEDRSPWARLCLPLGLVAGAVGAAAFAMDGFALGGLGADWKAASGAGKAAVLERAGAVLMVERALFTIAIMSLFGAASLVYGLALRDSQRYPKWIGLTAIAGGVAGLASGTAQWMAGELNIAGFLILFTISSVLFAAWLIGASLELYRSGDPARLR